MRLTLVGNLKFTLYQSGARLSFCILFSITQPKSRKTWGHTFNYHHLRKQRENWKNGGNVNTNKQEEEGRRRRKRIAGPKRKRKKLEECTLVFGSYLIRPVKGYFSFACERKCHYNTSFNGGHKRSIKSLSHLLRFIPTIYFCQTFAYLLNNGIIENYILTVVSTLW